MTLCLANGERIKLKSNIKILFEVLNLTQASPATVSRCGMVYLDASIIDSNSLIHSKLYGKLSSFFEAKPELAGTVVRLLSNAIDKTMPSLRKAFKAQAIIRCTQLNLTMSVCRMLESMIASISPAHLLANEKKNLDRLLAWSLAWGLGSHLNERSHDKLQKQLYEATKN